MLDNIGLQVNEVSENEFMRIARRMGHEMPINAERIKFKWASLFVQYFPNAKRMTIKNSIHKFYNNELGEEGIGFENYNDFDRWDLVQAVDYISSYIFERPLSDFKLFSKFEWGLNIDTEALSPFDIINRYKSCIRNASNEFHTMPPNTGKPLCRTCFFDDYGVKAYDKSTQACFTSGNILRYEIVHQGLTMLKRVLKIPEVTLHDVVLPNVWDTLFGNMMDIYDQILKVPLGVNQVTVDDLRTIHQYCDVQLNSDLKKMLSNSEYQALRSNDKSIYQRFDSDDSNVHNLIRKKMTDKFALLKLGDMDFTTLN
jgi:hypothetical protein